MNFAKAAAIANRMLHVKEDYGSSDSESNYRCRSCGRTWRAVKTDSPVCPTCKGKFVVVEE